MTEHVWWVEKGQYSDYRVVGVYDSEASARRIAECRIADYAEVRRVPLNPCVEELNSGLVLYRIDMMKDGTVSDVRPEKPYDPERAEYLYHRMDASRLWGCVWAKSEEHAVKIMNEKRVQLIANGEL